MVAKATKIEQEKTIFQINFFYVSLRKMKL